MSLSTVVHQAATHTLAACCRLASQSESDSTDHIKPGEKDGQTDRQTAGRLTDVL